MQVSTDIYGACPFCYPKKHFCRLAGQDVRRFIVHIKKG